MSLISLREWAKLAAAEAARGPFGFSSYHLDELDGLPAEVNSLGAAIDVVRRATAAIEDFQEATVRLAVPASHVEEMTTALPSLDPWSVADPEPPSLYFLEHRHLTFPTDREGYRCPYELSELADAGITAEFDCSRRLEDRMWEPPEWTNTVWFFSIPRIMQAANSTDRGVC